MDKKTKKIEVSLILLVHNAQTTLLEALASIKRQDYKINEVFVIDNHSTDNSVKILEEFKKNNKALNVKIIRRDRMYGVAASYNMGAKLAKSDYLVTFHSDASLPTKHELEELIKPFTSDPDVIATAPFTLLPNWLWEKYNFWQKYTFANVAGKEVPSGNGKFDCIKRDIFLKIGGSDEVNFGGQKPVGGEDGDLHVRLRKEGKVVLSKARVIHLHYMGKDYSLKDVIKSKWIYARSYGRFLRMQINNLSLFTISLFLVKPILGILPFIPGFTLYGILLLLIFGFVYTPKMFISPATFSDLRILLIPLLNIFFIYYELFWMIRSFLFIDRD